ncbi:MAG: glutamine synthetase [Anaerolineae bacterium]|nr:glutamine synthetase [Anaerolineae bacterium]
MTGLSPEANKVIAQARNDQIAYIDLQFTDITGIIKAVQIPLRGLETALMNGVWFDGSSVEGFARVAESDMYLRLDPATYTPIAWEPDGRRVARLMCDVVTPTGDPFPGDPRYVLRRALQAAAELGFRYVVAPEIEFFLLRPANEGDGQAPRPQDMASYFDIGDAEARAVRRAIVDALESIHIAVDSGHHEVAGGQHELDLAPLDALRMADAILTVRQAVKAIAQQHGLLATFMPKPFGGAAGSGMHIHQALVNLHTGANALADENAEYGLSGVGRAFLAGQLAHAREMCAVLAPLVNSYKRLVSGLEAPVYVTWAQRNRSALIRVPRVRQGESEQVRAELRCADPSCNPYLAFAVMLRAGLDGIVQERALPAAAEEELYAFNARRRQIETLPTSLHEALAAMEGAELVSEALGLTVFEGFLDAKRIEWNEYARQISPWEVERYLNTY